LDTNAVLDWLVFRATGGQALFSALARGELQWLTTDAMLQELRLVLLRPWPARWQVDVKRALAFDLPPVNRVVDAAPPGAGERLVCSDPSDQKFIDLALAQRTAWLVTHDKALLRLRRRAAARGVCICTPEQWRPLA
jgi:predicted nucleic acid-binding protein